MCSEAYCLLTKVILHSKINFLCHVLIELSNQSSNPILQAVAGAGGRRLFSQLLDYLRVVLKRLIGKSQNDANKMLQLIPTSVYYSYQKYLTTTRCTLRTYITDYCQFIQTDGLNRRHTVAEKSHNIHTITHKNVQKLANVILQKYTYSLITS